ncbi:HEPN domain-containing protein [Planctomycetota bacterium]
MNEHRATPEALRAMLKKARDKLTTARKDIEFEFYADAASRSYYGAFHAVSAVLAEQGLSYTSHAQTLGAFNREFVKTGIFPPDTFRKLQRLFEDRQVGDYDWSVSIDKETAAKDIDEAEWLVDACIEYLEEKIGQSLR